MEGVLTIVIAFYCLLMLYYHRSLNKLFKSKEKGDLLNVSIDLVIAYRNEMDNLPNLMSDLGMLDCTGIDLTVYLINDHSTDEGPQFVDDCCQDSNRFIRPINLSDQFGKKAAINQVIQKLTADWVLFTDADCRMDRDWIQSYRNTLSQNHEAVCVIGSVKLTGGNTLFKRFQQLEFMSLQAATAASCLANRPIMCNGANWMINRAAYLKESNQIKSQLASGDDMFILHALKKEKSNSIVYNRMLGAKVETETVENLANFWQQRNRWTAKSKYYTDSTTILISLLVLFANISFLMAIWYAFDTPGVVWFILAKLASEFMVLQRYANFSGEKSLLKDFPLLAIFYPVYIILIVLSSIFVKFQWKDRSYKA